MKYYPIVGLEIHVELKTKTKMFCNCSAQHFQVDPNTHTCPVCLGLPGALPIPNQLAIKWCQLIGLSLNCSLASFSKFDRKNYFYPDLSKGYQISQYDQPLCLKGFINLNSGQKIGITRVHMEEDTAKNVHQDGKTLVDFNRSGVPLVEIVTEPDFRNGENIDEFLKKLRRLIRYLGVSDADMEKGSMRLELNMSLSRVDPNSPNFQYPEYKVEVKNINSFRFLQKAFNYELNRQSEILDSGLLPEQETRGYQEDVDRTISQRSKEDAQDYRYFPEPDIPPMQFDQNYFDDLKNQLPELPDIIESRFINDYQLNPELAKFLTESKNLSLYFEELVSLGKTANLNPKDLANLIKNKKYNWTELSPNDLIAKIVAEKSENISDETTLTPIIKAVITANPKVIEDYQKGKTQVIGFLIGQVMQKTQGKADPKIVQKLFQLIINNL